MKTVKTTTSLWELPLEITYEYYAGSKAFATFSKCMLVSAEPEVQPEVEIQEVLLNVNNILPFLTPTQVAEIEGAMMEDANASMSNPKERSE